MVSVTSSEFDATLLAIRIVPSANPAFASIPKHIGFVVDTSGSMDEYGRLISVKKTMELIFQAKPASYAITIVAFSASARLVAEAEKDATVLQTALTGLVPLGGTNLEAGLLAIREAHRRNPMDAIVLLTDGEVTSGSIVSTTGLLSLATSSFPTKIPIHTIGVGEGYNRELLTALAKATRSLHMYADAAEALPAVAGDILAGVQAEIGTHAVLRFPPSYRCLEGEEGTAEFTIGTLIAEKEQWVLFRKGDERGVVLLSYKGSDGEDVTHTIPLTTELRRVDIAAQRDRILSTQQMIRIYEAIERGRTEEALEICRTFLATLGASEATEEPLVLCIKAQFAELVEQLTRRATGPPPTAALLSRLASNTSALTTQRGFVSRMASGGSDTHTFSSPSQQVAQRSMTTSYSEDPSAI